MKKERIAIIILLATLIFPAQAYCHHASVSNSLGEACPITTFSATTLPEHSKLLGLHTTYTSFDTFSESELEEAARAGNDIHSIRYLLTESVIAAYGVTEDLTLSLNLPYVWRSRILEGVNNSGVFEAQNRGGSQGLGDLTIFSEYRFLNLKNTRLESALLLGIKTPTGTTRVKDKEGARFETEHQPGSGSWDPSIGIALTKHIGQFSFDTNYLYLFANKGAQKTYLGDIFNYNFSISYCPRNEEEHEYGQEHHHHYSWNYVLELNGEWHQKQNINGETDRNSGGNTINLSPGVRLSTGKDWIYSLSVGIPVFQQLNGRQNKSQTSLILEASKGF